MLRGLCEAEALLLNVGWIGQIPGMEMGPCCHSINCSSSGKSKKNLLDLVALFLE